MALWIVLWMIFVSDFPSNHPRISLRERDYIIDSLSDQVDEKATKVRARRVACK
jgi:hypothetical protein